MRGDGCDVTPVILAHVVPFRTDSVAVRVVEAAIPVNQLRAGPGVVALVDLRLLKLKAGISLLPKCLCHGLRYSAG